MNLIPLTAGPLSLALDAGTGAIRWLHAGGREILRGINAPIRDDAWLTVLPEISGLEIARGTDAFCVTFVARCRAGPVDFKWRGEIRGETDGALTFDFDGEALSDFRRNRIGFCVLHPAEAAGAACAIEHVDGARQNATFPRDISPHQPFFNVRAITHAFAPGWQAEVRMEGETFETEDQRNWSDASFKTYCTSLARPRPVLVRRDDRIRQRVTVRLRGSGPAPASDAPCPWEPPGCVEVRLAEALPNAPPQLGTIWNAGAPESHLLDALRPLRLAHLRVDLALDGPEFAARWHEAAAASVALGIALEPALFVDDAVERQIAAFAAGLGSLAPAPRIARWLIFHRARAATPPKLIALLRDRVTGTPFAAPVGGGAIENFTELNREPAVARIADFTVHGCNPQVHAFDAASLIETLAMQGLAVENARRLSGGRPAAVSPISFTPRWPADAVGRPPALSSGLMPFREDPRQTSPFAAGWTLGSIAALAESGAASATYFEAVGPNGILTPNGRLQPVGEMLARVAPLIGERVVRAHVSHPRHVAALAVKIDGVRRLLLANLGVVHQAVRIDSAGHAHTLALAPDAAHVLELPALSD